MESGNLYMKFFEFRYSNLSGNLTQNPKGKPSISSAFCLENGTSRCLESSKYPKPFDFAGEKLIELYQQNKIQDFLLFVDQATPRFELGKKDLQSPALPLGHVAKPK